MNLLIVGTGQGSWAMRGQQLAAALGARIAPSPAPADLEWADLCVLVKHAGPRYAALVHAAGVPLVWDAVDFWRQPAENGLTEGAARTRLRETLRVIKPALTIGATTRMARACGGAYLSHHCWQGLCPTPARERMQMVAYQGNASYLGRWRERLEQACARRGWTFVINPSDLREADLLIALRDGIWDGWMCREWKSGVKLVNAIAAGRPILRQDTAAAHDLCPAGTQIATTQDLSDALDEWTDCATRQAVVESSTAGSFAVESVAAVYRTLLDAVLAERQQVAS